MKSKLLKNLSANTGQLVLNQLLGLLLFYLLSTGLDKSSFGQLNLALAISLLVFSLLSMGIDQVSIRKIAAGDDAQQVLSIYLFHVLITGAVFYALLLIAGLFIPAGNSLYPLLLLVAGGKLMIYCSTPLKQAASGLECFRALSVMLVISNAVRGGGLLLLALMHVLSLHHTVLLFITGDTLEFACCVFIFRRATRIPIRVKWHRSQYLQLLREALPQTGVTIITSAMARFDWIFIGIMVSSIKLAEYSFAYKVFEMATLPLLAIAPLLIPRFTKLFKQDDIPVNQLKLLIRAEMIVAALTVLLVNIGWSPVIDAVTGGKYGAANVQVIFILSLCIPFLYLNNFLWTIYFAQGRMKMILHGFILTFLVNALLDVALIPFFKNEGAAIAFLAASMVQSVFYMRKNELPGLSKIWYHLLICLGSAALSFVLISLFITNYLLAMPLCTLIFFALLLLTRQIKPADRHALRLLFSA